MRRPEGGKVHVLTLVGHPALGGGAERLAMEISVRLDAAQYDRTLCVSRWAEHDPDPLALDSLRRILDDARVRLIPLDRRACRSVLAWAPLVTTLRREGVEVLHAHLFGSNVWGCVLGRIAGVPVVVAHEHSWAYEGWPLRRLLDRHLIARLSDVFVAVSSEDRRRMIEIEGIPPERIQVVPNGIPPQPAPSGRDVRVELEIERDAPVLGVVAMQRPEKGLDVLFRGVSLLIDRHPKLRLLVVGSGLPEERARLGALVDQLGLANVVSFLGSRADVPDILAALDVAVSSSRREGSPLAVMEYMAAGLPIAATRVGGVPDLIEDGRHGLLVEPEDPGALAAAIDRLLNDRDLGSRLGREARVRQAAEMDIGVTVGRVSGLYQRLLARKGRGLRVEPLGDGLEALRPRWEELAQASGSPFATHEWAATWWKWFGGRRPLRLLACRRRDGALAAILPLYEDRKGPVRITRFLGHGPGDELGPVCSPECRPAALAALRRALADGALRTDVLLAERLPIADGGDLAFEGDVLRREASPGLSLEGLDWEGFLAARSRNFREQVRRRERTLERSHGLRYRLADDPQRLDDDLGTLFGLHNARWGTEGSGAFAGARAGFHRDIAALALARGWLRLWLLEADGDPVAAWYGFRFGGREWYYQSGRDPTWDRRSVGFVLLCHTIRSAMQDGMCEYRLLRGDETYKGRFATHDHPLETRAVACGLLGRAAVASVRAADAGPEAVRARLRNLTG